jgi:carnitine 3-dehydrogenase
LHAGDSYRVTTDVVDADEKRLHLSHVLLRDGEPDPIATAQQTLVHVDVATGRAAPVDADVRAQVDRLVR